MENLQDMMQTVYDFCDHLLTNEKLDEEIYNTVCLKLLYVLLNIKSRKIKNKECDKSKLQIYTIYEQDSDNLPLQCEVLKLALSVAENEDEEIENVIKYLIYVIKNSPNMTTTTSLKVVHILKEICIKNKNYFKKYIPVHINEFLLCNLIHKDSPIRIYILSHILNDYLNLLNAENLLSFVQEIFVYCKINKNLDILCSICNDMNIQLTLMEDEKSILYKDEFWTFLGNSIFCCDNNGLQKQATFLLEILVYVWHDNSLNTIPPLIKIINMPQEESKKIWQHFFILLEALKEKQAHIVRPALKLLHSIKHLNYFWQKCLYKVLLNHPHNTIVSLVIQYVLQENVICPDLFHTFLSTINGNDYLNFSCNMLKKIPLFCNNLNETHFSAFLNGVSQIKWTPTSMWYFFNSLFSSRLEKKIPLKHFKPIYELVLKAPHIFIRNGCVKIFITYYLKNYDWYDSFDSIFKMLVIIRQYNENVFANLVKQRVDSHFINSKTQVECITNNRNFEHFDVFVQIIKIVKPEEMQIVFLKNIKKFSDELLVIICANNLDYFSKTDLENVIEEITNINHYAINSVLVIVNHMMKHPDFDQWFFGNIVNVLLEPCKYSCTKIYITLYIATHCFSTTSAIKDIVNKWINSNFLNNSKFDSNILIQFYELYFLTVENCDISILENLATSANNLVISRVFENFVKIVIPKNLMDFNKTLEICLHILSNLTKTKYFKEFCQNYITCLFSIDCSRNDIQTQDLFRNSINMLLQYGEIYPSVNYYLSLNVKNFVNHADCDNYYNIIITVLVELLLKEFVTKKEERLEYNCCQDICEKLGAGEDNPNMRTMVTRLSPLESMLHIISKRTELADNFTSCLIEKYRLYFNKRYFPDSQIHLHKLRIIQALLIIHPFINKQRQPLIDLIMDSFCTEIHQPCVKQLMQWLLFFLLKNGDDSISLLVNKIESTNKTQPSTVAALILVLLHITFTKSEPFWCSAIEALLPWCMGPHFKLRVYSQMAVKMLHKEAKHRSYGEFSIKYGFLNKSVNFIIEASGKAFQDTLKADELIFSYFSPERDYSLQTILDSIPRLNNVTSSEWENFSHYKFTYEGHIPITNIDRTFENSITNRPKINTSKDESICENISESNFNIQRKITPWKMIMEEIETNKPLGDFILIASLIDKPANLGGLSRTCEVFGVKQMVLNDNKIIKDKNFMGLSMTSENWIQCLEVKVPDLKKFIFELRDKGYCIVGAEQTSESEHLHKYQFNKKTALLLGNEKEGIPPDLIPILDACVEIPQLGLVRSLNVHVAGATFIWEYAKQHLIR